MAVGRKTGGRKKGTRNRSSGAVVAVCERLNLEPAEGIAMIAMGKVPCDTCEGGGRIPHETNLRKKVLCPNCLGTGREPIPIALRGQMLVKLGEWIYPKLKSIEHRASDSEGNTVSLTELLAAYAKATRQ